jgi:DNA-directed RNA polymerase subunit RPC12/RpoP
MLRRSGVSTRTPPGLSKLKPPDRCPHCNGKRLIKKGTRRKKLEDVPLYRCRSCGRTFSIGPRAIRNKTYPLPEILEAFTLYDRGNTLEETAEKISSHYGHQSLACNPTYTPLRIHLHAHPRLMAQPCRGLLFQARSLRPAPHPRRIQTGTQGSHHGRHGFLQSGARRSHMGLQARKGSLI